MFLKELSIFGFKSFAQKTSFKFERGITGVVGPNGSGKSNIADAVRWVIGESSGKLLRAKKSEDVIFFGSDLKSKSSYAEVELVFDNSAGRLKLSNEISIARRYYRSGESEYLINGKKVRLLDVIELLSQAGLSESSHFVVGQGMADAILSANPVERKDYFDAAAGVKEFEIKRDRSVKKLEQSLIETHRIKDILREISPRLEHLKKQIERTKERKELSAKLALLQVEYYSYMSYSFTQKLDSVKDRLYESQKNIHDIEAEINTLNANLNEAETSDSTIVEKQKELKEKKAEIEATLSDQRQKIVALQERLKFEDEMAETATVPNDFAEKFTKLIDDLEASIKEITKKPSTSALNELLTAEKSPFVELQKLSVTFQKRKREKPDFNALSKLIDNEKKGIAVSETKLAEINLTLEKLEQDVTQKGKKYTESSKKIFALQQELTKLNGTSSELSVEKARIETRFEDMLADIQELSPSILDAVKEAKKTELADPKATKLEMDRLKSRVAALGSEEEDVDEEFEDVADRHELLSKELLDLEKAINHLNDVRATLDEIISTRFTQSFIKIDTEFSHFFRTIFNGGEAKLTLREDPETKILGIEIIASPPGKKVQSLSALSGGERSLTSIALLSAFLKINPSPFVVLDEVDAALDELNTHRFLKIVKDLSSKTEFIMVTHNRETMKQCNVLYGVTMGEDHASKIISVKLEEAEEYAQS